MLLRNSESSFLNSLKILCEYQEHFKKYTLKGTPLKAFLWLKIPSFGLAVYCNLMFIAPNPFCSRSVGSIVESLFLGGNTCHGRFRRCFICFIFFSPGIIQWNWCTRDHTLFLTLTKRCGRIYFTASIFIFTISSMSLKNFFVFLLVYFSSTLNVTDTDSGRMKDVSHVYFMNI